MAVKRRHFFKTFVAGLALAFTPQIEQQINLFHELRDALMAGYPLFADMFARMFEMAEQDPDLMKQIMDRDCELHRLPKIVTP